MHKKSKLLLIVSVFMVLFILPGCETKAKIELLNVSYDPTRELYEDYNKVFAMHWKKQTGQDIVIQQSHAGSGKQARSVIDGLEADVVTLALSYDIDSIVKKSGYINEQWQKQLPFNSAPYVSTIVFMVRKGNPKNINNWDDLARPGIAVITPNPKVSGGARWNFLAGWGYALKKWGNDEIKAAEFMKAIFKNVAVLDSGARAATTTFVERGMGDVFISWENEVYLAVNEIGHHQFEIVYPSMSILAEPTVAVVDENVDRRKTRQVAEEYLRYLYSNEGQELIVKHYYRPRSEAVAQKYRDKFPAIELFTIEEVFGGWQKAQAKFFSDKGIFDQIYEN